MATNAGGINVVRYGTMRAQVMGVEAVLGDGSVVSHLAGLPKDNTGYDLAGLLTGSEGTLGVITAARLRLVPRLDHRVTAGLGFRDIAAAIDAVIHLRATLPSLHAVELVLAEGVALVAADLGVELPPRAALAGRPDRRGGGPERSAGGAGGRRGRPRPGGRAGRRRDPGAAPAPVAAAGGLRGRHQPPRPAGQARRLGARSGGPRTSSDSLPRSCPAGWGSSCSGTWATATSTST